MNGPNRHLLRRYRPVAALLLAALAASCASGASLRAWDDPVVRPAWPDAPHLPRVEYVGAISGLRDLPEAENWWSRLSDIVFGTVPGGMVRPASIATSANGQLAVADPGLPGIHWYDLQAGEAIEFPDALDERLLSPVGVALDDEGTLYIADSKLATVIRVTAGGTADFDWLHAQLERPSGLLWDRAHGQLLVVDTLACQVIRLAPDGTELSRIGMRGSAPGEFNYPTQIAVAPDGTLLVSDTLNFRVQRLAADGSPLAQWGGSADGPGNLPRPKGIAVDQAGRVFVIDAAFENVQVWDKHGKLLLVFGGNGTAPGRFVLPMGMTIDDRGRIWVADSFNQRVQAFRLVEEAP